MIEHPRAPRALALICSCLAAATAAAQTPPPAPAATPMTQTTSPTPRPPAADPADVSSIDAIVAALYDVISGPAGEKRDWARFRSLFAPGEREVFPHMMGYERERSRGA